MAAGMAVPRCAVVLAAGKGTRFYSSLPKVLHPLCGTPMLEHVLIQLAALQLSQTLVVVGNQADRVQRRFSGWPVEWVVQEPQLGTAHAVSMTESQLREKRGSVLVLHGDGPLITSERLLALLRARERSDAALALMTSRLEDPAGYGRVIQVPGKPVQIVEEKDATPEQKKIQDVNPGYYCFDLPVLFPVLRRVSDDNEQREYLLTDAVGILGRDALPVETVEAPAEEVLGVNDRSQLARAEAIMQKRINRKRDD